MVIGQLTLLFPVRVDKYVASSIHMIQEPFGWEACCSKQNYSSKAWNKFNMKYRKCCLQFINKKWRCYVNCMRIILWVFSELHVNAIMGLLWIAWEHYYGCFVNCMKILLWVFCELHENTIMGVLWIAWKYYYGCFVNCMRILLWMFCEYVFV